MLRDGKFVFDGTPQEIQESDDPFVQSL